MKIEKNRFVIPLTTSCTYCDVDWCLMYEKDRDTIYYDPEDDSLICKPCHKAYGPADSTVEPNP